MQRNVLLLIISCLTVIFFYESCTAPTRQDSKVPDSVLAEYVKHNVVLADSIINYAFEDSILILKFPGEPESKKWMIRLDTCPYNEYRTNYNNEIVITEKCPRVKGDSSVFFMQMVPDDRYIYYYGNSSDIVYFVFYSNQKGVLHYQKPGISIFKIDTQIGQNKYFNDPRFHKYIVDSLNALVGPRRNYFK